MQLLKRIIIIVLLLIVLLFGVLFSIQNDSKAPLDLLIVQLSEQKVALWVLLAFALGGILGMVISSMTIIKLRGDLLLMRRKLSRHEKDLEQLKTTDIKKPPSIKRLEA